jgi:DNA gyrase subunit A
MVVIENGDRDILAISSKGFGKRSSLSDYRVQTRGGKGIITMKTTDRTGRLVTIKGVQSSDDLMIVTHNGLMIRMDVAGISTLGRNTQGVRLINLKPGDAIADVTRLVIEEEVEADLEGDGATSGGVSTDGELPTNGEASADGQQDES